MQMNVSEIRDFAFPTCESIVPINAKSFDAYFGGNHRKAASEVLTFSLPNAIINNAVWV
jgi:hypothetical protein